VTRVKQWLCLCCHRLKACRRLIFIHGPGSLHQPNKKDCQDIMYHIPAVRANSGRVGCQRVPHNEDAATEISAFEALSQPHRTRQTFHRHTTFAPYCQLPIILWNLFIRKCGLCAADRHILYRARAHHTYHRERESHRQHSTS
jgi:hypothetical protein